MATKYNLPQTQTMVTKLKRYQALFVIIDKTVEEIAELNQLQLDLVDYMITATDFNSKAEQSDLDAFDSEITIVENAIADHLSSATAHPKSAIGLGSVDNNKQMPIVGGTFTGAAIGQTNTNYSTAQLRNVVYGTTDPAGAIGTNGTLYVKYKV